MSRFRRAAHALASGYVVLATSSVFALVSVPVALHYLPEMRLFGLWGLMSSIQLFFSLVDFGMSGSVARLLIDHKDDRAGGVYGGLVKTGWLVLLAQGVIAFVAGYLLAPVLGAVLHGSEDKGIPPELQPTFVALVRWQCAILALGFATRIFGHILAAFQRYDIVNYSSVVAGLLNLGLLWWFLATGSGVFSLIWAGLLSLAVSNLLCGAACWRLGLFPPAGAWGRASWRQFKELFGYGKDVFLVGVGSQLILYSQPLIITACLGLKATTAWTIGTRPFAMIIQAVWRVFDFSGPAFSEMMVRGEQPLLRERYKSVLVLSASLAGVAAVCFVLCNSAFFTVWTYFKQHTEPGAGLAWFPVYDLFLGVWMVVLAVQHCHDTLVLLTKKVGALRYMMFVEGLVFAAAALLSAGWGGLPAVIGCSIVCTTCFSGAYGVWRVSHSFGLSVREVALRWLRPMAEVLIRFIPAALLIWWVGGRLNWLPAQGVRGNEAAYHALFNLAFNAVLGGTLGLCLFLRYGLPEAIQQELLQRSPGRIRPVLRRLF